MGTKSMKVTRSVLMIKHINCRPFLNLSFLFLCIDVSDFEINKDLLNRKMPPFAFLVLAASLYVLEAEDIDFKPCVNSMTNGCSIPLGIAFPYKDLFLPACERHDVCYSCVSDFCF